MNLIIDRLLLVVLLVGFLFGTGLAFAQERSPINLLDNSSFERVDKQQAWSVKEGSVFRFTSDVSLTGKYSLNWDNSNPDTYELVTQKVPLTSGRSYELSAWIKTEDVKGVRESGATIALGYSGHDEKYITGGPHPGGQKGTRDWWQLIAYTGAVPQDVGYGTFTCYVRKNSSSGKSFTGRVWWDDVQLRPVSMEVHILKPFYKSRITDEQSQISLEANVWPEDFNLGLKDIQIHLQILKSGQNTSVAIDRIYTFDQESDKRTMVVAEDLKQLVNGEYDVRIEMIHANTKQILWQEHRSIYRVSESLDQLRVHIDEHRRLILDGKPFFPIGVYTRNAPVKDLAGTAFNCFMSYDELSSKQMDAAHEANLKVIYSIKNYFNKIWYSPTKIQSIYDEVPAIRSRVKALRDHPALLAWYVNDELGPDCLLEHRAHYKLLNEEDPHHPAWSLHNKPFEMPTLMDTADVMGIDTYPVPEEPLAKVAEDMLATQNAVRNARAVWAVPQIFNWTVFGREGRPPTLEEMRCMSWQAICNDASGLIFYSLAQLRRDKKHSFEKQFDAVKVMAAEVANYSDILLSIEKLPVIRVSYQAWLHWTARKIGDTLYIFAVNDASGEGEVMFEIGQNVSKIQRVLLSDKQVKTCREIDSSKWQEKILKSEVHIYKIKL